MDNTLDQTTLSTISLLEARLLRIEHLLYGKTPPAFPVPEDASAKARLADLESRLGSLVSSVKVYGDILQLHKSNFDVFHPDSTIPNFSPSSLPDAAVLATVLASAPSFSATVSALNAAVKDHPIPEASQSAAVVELRDRIRAAHATQVAQAAEMSGLRARSEALIRRWYENGVLGSSGKIADVEARLGKVEGTVRRRERALTEEKEF